MAVTDPQDMRDVAEITRTERETEEATSQALALWVLVFLAAMGGSETISPNPARANHTRDEWIEVYAPAIIEAGMKAWRRRYKKVRKAKKYGADETEILAYLTEFVTYVPDRYFRDAKTILDNGIKNSLTAEEIRDEMQEKLTNLRPVQAESVARQLGPTIVNDATLTAAQDLSEATGVQFSKSWVALLDDKVREAHAVAAANPRNDRIPLGADFDCGGFPAKHPRDIRLPASLSVNCRCIARIHLV